MQTRIVYAELQFKIEAAIDQHMSRKANAVMDVGTIIINGLKYMQVDDRGYEYKQFIASLSDYGLPSTVLDLIHNGIADLFINLIVADFRNHGRMLNIIQNTDSCTVDVEVTDWKHSALDSLAERLYNMDVVEKEDLLNPDMSGTSDFTTYMASIEMQHRG